MSKDERTTPDLRLWGYRDRFTVREAAILWSGQDPKSQALVDGYGVMIEVISKAVMTGELRAEAQYLTMEYTDDTGETHKASAVDDNTSTVARDDLLRWAATVGPIPNFLLHSVSVAERAGWVQGGYTTANLKLLEMVIERFWAHRLPGDRVPKKREIVAWLTAMEASDNVARAIDLIARSDDDPHKSRKPRTKKKIKKTGG